MNLAAMFMLSNLFVVPFWFLMIVLPNWRWTNQIMQSPLVALPPAVLYALLVIPQLGQLLPAVSNPELMNIAALLGTPAGATVAWAHFVAFDLLVGRWAFLDSREQRIYPLIMAAVLFLIFMLGPIGYLSYLGVRSITQRMAVPQTIPA
jgi:Domain of unknown function (DUF4281)